MKKVSVIIPCYNASRWIVEALQSVLEQRLGNFEIIVIDDGSKDNSSEIAGKAFPSIRLVKTENRGPSRARNLGTSLSTGDLIQYLDADDIMAPGKIKAQMEALEASGGDVAYGDYQKLFERGDGSYKDGEWAPGRIANPEVGLFTGESWRPIHSYLFKREIVERIGGWNERLPFIQDARFALDCALHGARFVYCPGTKVYYRIRNADSVSTRNPVAHTRDCFRNAFEVEEWWMRHGGLSKARREALLQVYGYVARASFRNDKPTFEAAYKKIEQLDPGYVPQGPAYLKVTSRLFGYKQAEGLIQWFSRIKHADRSS